MGSIVGISVFILCRYPSGSYAVIGSVLDYVSTLQTKYGKSNGPFEITRREGAKYAVLNFGDKYEARVLIDSGKISNLQYVANQLRNKDFEVTITGDGKIFQLIKAFSKQAYLEIMCFYPRIEVKMIYSCQAVSQGKLLLDNIITFLIL